MSITVNKVEVLYKSFEPPRAEIGALSGVIRYVEDGVEKQFFAIGKYDATNETLINAQKWDNLCSETGSSDTTRDEKNSFTHAICTYFEHEKNTFLDTSENPAKFYLDSKNLNKLTIDHKNELITNKSLFLQDFVKFMESESGIEKLSSYL